MRSCSEWLLDVGMCLLLLMVVTVVHCLHICMRSCLSVCWHMTCFLCEYVC